LRQTCVSTYASFGGAWPYFQSRIRRLFGCERSAPLIGDDPSMTLLLFLKRTKEADRTPNKGRQVDSSLVCFRSQALELMGFGVDNAV